MPGLVPPDEVNLKKIRPFTSGESVVNPDGTRSTERTIGINIGGKEVVVPSLWMTPEGPVSGRPETVIRAVREYESRTGKKFPRFDNPEEANEFARGRSSAGGRQSGSLFE